MTEIENKEIDNNTCQQLQYCIKITASQNIIQPNILSEKLRSIYSCQTQIQVIDIRHSPEMILKYIKALPTALY